MIGGIAHAKTVYAPSIDVRTDLSPAAWDAYVTSRPDASVYHLSAWAGLLKRVFGRDTRYLAAHAGGRVVGILPLALFRSALFGRFAVSMPFVNYGGVVADSREAADALLAAAFREAQLAKAAYLELRHSKRIFDELPAQTHKVAMVLPLQQTIDEQWQVLDRKLRNQVRKAEKSGLRINSGGPELLDAFYRVLARNMRDLGSPVHSPRLFEDIMRTLPDRTRVLVVYLGPTPIAASLVLWNGHRMEVPWASAIRDHNALCPNVLLYWEMLKFAIERRMTHFDFGRSTPFEGTYKFKLQWGAVAHQLYWEYWLAEGAQLPDRSPKNPKFGSAISLWQRLPVPVTRALGPLLVRQIP